MSREDGTIEQDALSFDLGAGIKDCTVLFQLGAAFDGGIPAFGVYGRTLPGSGGLGPVASIPFSGYWLPRSDRCWAQIGFLLSSDLVVGGRSGSAPRLFYFPLAASLGLVFYNFLLLGPIRFCHRSARFSPSPLLQNT
ncbi:hypothetical protein U1Q18_020502 [Sarracenia purpurea var. burkii]